MSEQPENARSTIEPTSAQRKLAWAITHLTRLRDEAAAYEKADAYVFHAVPERRSPQRIDYRCFATERLPPDPNWPLLAGDAIQNLRATLDHLVWAATPVEKQSRRTAFPIYEDADEFTRRGASKYAHVSEAMKATIASAQPFERQPNEPSQDELAILQRLSNLDKHRTLATIVSAVEFEGIGTTDPTVVEWTEPATGRSLGSGETYVSAFTVTTSAPRLDEGEIDTRFWYEVVIEEQTIDTLAWIARRVYELLVAYETGSPPHLLAQYPI